jgi:cytochrome c oxidase accessory protein FixG
MEPKDNIYLDESFRDSISTIGEDGNRNWIYPKKPKGNYTNKRNIVAYTLLTLLFIGPFLKINGNPFLMINVLERKFIIFGQIFWPQDFFIFGLSMITFIVFIILFTVVFGRVWCGWACPQTIFMENVFRKIEYLIEGDFKEQKRLDKLPWNKEKMLKKGSKWAVFYAISFLIANTFLAYIIGIDELKEIITDNPKNHVAGLSSLLIFTTIFYFVFAWFREQVCLIACPYGRLQGVMLDSKSLVVAYDYVRGEPRERLKKERAADKGDCIACGQCVNVCPTGIDIRNGTQLECVNCTACMDACDSIMLSINKPKGLIRIESDENIKEKKPFEFSFRMKAYVGVLALLLVFLSFLLLSRTSIDGTILRTPGVMYQKTDAGNISNLYNFKLINKTNKDINIQLELSSHEGIINVMGINGDIIVPAEELFTGSLFVEIDPKLLDDTKNTIKVDVLEGDKKLKTIKTTFMKPL